MLYFNMRHLLYEPTFFARILYKIKLLKLMYLARFLLVNYLYIDVNKFALFLVTVRYLKRRIRERERERE